MESGISATTPLFIHHDEDYISPTKPLNFATEKYEEDLTTTTHFKSNKTLDHNKDYSFKSLSSVSNSSFKTAPSLMNSENDDVEIGAIEVDYVDELDKPIINTWMQDESTFDATPIVGVEETTEDNFSTPKAFLRRKSHVDESPGHDSVEIEHIAGEEKAGLGLAGRNSGISISSYINTANAAKVISAKSSPVKAIRMSMIVNGQIDSDPIDEHNENRKTIDSTKDRELYEVSQNDKSFVSGDLSRKPTLKKSSEISLDEDNFAYLFIIAIHSFNAESLQNPDDISICLSFEKDDVAFVHTVDETGWGEVTLLKNKRRGWVPFNYFSDTVKLGNPQESSENLQKLIESRLPLQKLLSACAKFLLHPQETPLLDNSGMTFNVDYINGVRDGVKTILEMTDCVSRSNELVQRKPDVRKARKLLLANWYNLMIKADFHKHSTNPKHVDNLIRLLYEVLNQAFAFFKVWSVEKKALLMEKEKKTTSSMETNERRPSTPSKVSDSDSNIPHLKEPPTAMSRLHEVYDLLFVYVGLILGRLDIIEHNPSGVEALESIVHQMIILLRELLYISKSCSAIIQDKFQYAYENTLHKNLDPLFSLVSELVSSVKVLVTQTLHEEFNIENKKLLIKDDVYCLTDQGERLIEVVSNMTTLISNSINGCSSYLRLIGDFRLGQDRQYIDFSKIKMTPDKFFEKCSLGLTKDIDKSDITETFDKARKYKSVGNDTHKRIARFSCIRAGTEDQLGFTYQGSQLLQDLLLDQKPFGRDSTFEPFRPDENEEDSVEKDLDSINDKESMENEVTFGKDGIIIGASFRALVYKLTDEMDKPDDFFIATCLLNFRSFASMLDLIDSLASRFDLDDKSSQHDYTMKNGQYSSRSSRIKNRRKLVCKIFQTWMESYWDYTSDYKGLPTLINFFNEGVSLYLPIEAKALIETAARLSASKPTTRAYRRGPRIRPQLKPKTVSQSKTNSLYSNTSSSSLSSRLSVFSLDEKIIEDYELTHVPSRSTSSLSLPLPILNLGTSSLLSKRNIHDMERLVNTYRSMVGKSIQGKQHNVFIPKNETSLLVKEWNELVTTAKGNYVNLIHNDMNLADLNPLELAKQFTLIESKLFLNIEPGELSDGRFLEKNMHLSLSPNVDAVVRFTNELSNYVMESVLCPNISLKTRVARLRAWLKIALSCLYFRNYNSVASIMTAIQNHAITRLVKIWDSLRKKDTELFEYLSRIVHPNNNFKVYRKKLRKYMDENVAEGLLLNKSPVPVVPFFNLFLQDLTFIDEGNPTYRNPDSFRPHKLINVDKFFKVTKTINAVNYFQVGYELRDEEVENISSFFNISDQLDVDTKNIKPIPLLQEFILYEFWRVNTLHASNNDRGYQLSLQLSPRK